MYEVKIRLRWLSADHFFAKQKSLMDWHFVLHAIAFLFLEQWIRGQSIPSEKLPQSLGIDNNPFSSRFQSSWLTRMTELG